MRGTRARARRRARSARPQPSISLLPITPARLRSQALPATSAAICTLTDTPARLRSQALPAINAVMYTSVITPARLRSQALPATSADLKSFGTRGLKPALRLSPRSVPAPPLRQQGIARLRAAIAALRLVDPYWLHSTARTTL